MSYKKKCKTLTESSKKKTKGTRINVVYGNYYYNDCGKKLKV